VCCTTNNFALHHHNADAFACSRCSGSISCRAAADDYEALIEVHVVEVIGATVVVVVLVVGELDVVVVDVVVPDVNVGRVVVGTGTEFGQY
jgi:hypothetical protein